MIIVIRHSTLSLLINFIIIIILIKRRMPLALWKDRIFYILVQLIRFYPHIYLYTKSSVGI